MSLKEQLIEELSSLKDAYRICGIVDKGEKIYPLGADTKVLSTIFELIARPVVYRLAKRLELQVVEPTVQNHYPDFTLCKDENDKGKIAIDVKTTYRNANGTFGYTLGGYTSFIRKGNERKNIVYSFDDYASHWVIGLRPASRRPSRSQARTRTRLRSAASSPARMACSMSSGASSGRIARATST
jgi:hypothetical protein